MAEDNKNTGQGQSGASQDKDKGKGGSKDAKAQGSKLKQFIQALNPRERTVIQVTLFVVAMLFLDIIIVHPMTSYLKKLDEEIKTQETIVPKRLLILKHKDRIMKEYKLGEKLMTDPNMTQEEEIAKLLSEIERVSKEVSLFIFNINPVKTNKKSDSVYELAVDIEGKGGLTEIRRFIRKIEGDNPAIRVGGYSLKPQSKESDELKYMLTVIKIGVKRGALALAAESSSAESGKDEASTSGPAKKEPSAA